MQNNTTDLSIALQVIARLSAGSEPATGVPLPADSIVHQSSVRAALTQARAALESQLVRDSRRGQAPRNVGAPWTMEEERLMMAAFDAGRSPIEIAATLERSLAGVEARLEKLGRITPELRMTRNRFRPAAAPTNGAGPVSEITAAD